MEESALVSAKSVASNGSAKVQKKVCFAEGTIEPRQDNVALSISRHTYSKELGYTQYFIQLMFRETEWSIYKRYRDFEELHNNLMSENFENGIDLPKLPKKRWFEKQRWLNKFDESYSSNRRCALQEYLRCLVHIPYLRRRSTTLKQFLDFRFSDADERVPDSEKQNQQKNEFFGGRGDINQPFDADQQSHPEVINEHHHIGVWHGDTHAPHNSNAAINIEDINLRALHVDSVRNSGELPTTSNDSSNVDAYFSSSPARSREGSEADSEDFDYNARVVNTPTDYNSNDSDDEPDGEDNEDNNNSNSNSNAHKTGLAVEADRDSLEQQQQQQDESASPSEQAVIGVTDSGEVVHSASAAGEEEDTRTTFST